MNANIRILFWLYRSKLNTKGQAPIYLRLTQGGERVQLSTGYFVEPQKWDNKKGRLRGENQESNYVNNGLDGLRARIFKIQSRFQLRDNYLSIDEIKHLLTSNERMPGFIECFVSFIERVKSLRDIDYAKGTEMLFEITKNHFMDFLASETGKKDIGLEKLDLSLAEKFSDYLKIELKNSANTVYKKLQRVNIVINHLVKSGQLEKNHFSGYKIKKDAKEIVYLTSVELKKIEQKQFGIPRLELVKDLFLFSCYSGLAYNEVNSLTKSNILPEEDGVQWIKILRKKTDKVQEVPLLREAISVIEKYKGCTHEKVFPSLSNQKLNSYLKEIADTCGINKHLTFHVARKTFATTVTLTKGVSIETISKLLGHSSISITASYYSQVSKEKILKEFMGK